jgi:hypothetical protein
VATTTGLSANPTEYRERLNEQQDAQLDAWASELLRDSTKRKGVIAVVADVQKCARLDEPSLRRVFARGGGAPATIGKDAEGHLIVPTISLHFLVQGMRNELPDARDRIVDYLVAGFHDIVYV